MSILNEYVEYNFNDVVLEAYIARPEQQDNLPVVLICHAWGGRDQFVCDTADKLADLGFVGVALDVYGKGIMGVTNEEKMSLMQPLLDDRALLQGRLQAGLEVASNLAYVNNTRVAAIGYCFGGLCVLDMARMQLNINAVISVHGLFNKPNNLSDYKIKPKVLALHGYLDPMVKPDDVTIFVDELDQAQADWQINTYGKALHAFTNPQANDQEIGTIFNQDIANRAWYAITGFLSNYV